MNAHSMFGRVAAFEFRYQATGPAFAVTSLLFFLLTFGAAASDTVNIGEGGNVLVNSPYAVSQMMMIMCVFALFILVAFVANVVVRDDETRFAALIHSTRITKFDYLFGRFTGALGAAVLLFVAVPLGNLVGAAMPWVDPETVGPVRLGMYAYTLFVLCVPTLFVMGAGFFALATATRSMLTTYVGVIVFLVLFFVATGSLDQPGNETLVAMIDPFGLGAMSQLTKYWTAADRNTLLVPLEGVMLWNRVLWFTVSFALLALAYRLFKVEGKPQRAAKVAADATDATLPTEPASSATAANPSSSDTAAAVRRAVLPASKKPGSSSPASPRQAAWAQLVALTRFDMAACIRSPAFVVLLGVGFINSLGSLWYADQLYDNTIYPVTRVMVDALMASFSIIPLIIAVYYAGELVWGNRDRRIHEIIDATPAPDWAFVVPKILAIALVLLATIASSTLAAMAMQAFKGFPHFELTHYLLWYILPFTVFSLLFAVLAVFFQVLVPHKFIGWMLMLLFVVSRSVMDRIGWEDNLYQYASGLPVPLSDMNGQGQFAAFDAWFRAYWAAFAVILVVLTHALWRRGALGTLWVRLRALPRRLRGAPGGIVAAAALTMAALGVFIHHNTHVLNPYRTTLDEERWTADYEKALLAFETAPQPRVTAVKLQVDLYPQESRAVAAGTYTLENRTGAPLSAVHVRWPNDVRMEKLEVQGGRLTQDFAKFQYQIYAFDQPLQAGEQRTLTFRSVREQRGFRNRGNDTRVVDNGTFLNNAELTPTLGMSRDVLLQDRNKRRKYGLPAELRPAKLEDDTARQFNGLRRDSDWVDLDIKLSTVADQIPVAPGYLLSDTTANGRRTVHYRTDAPIQHFFSMQSARYAVKRDRWREVELAVYHDPGHVWNVDRMLAGMKDSLDYFTREFSPFQFRQVRILEFPAYATFAQSFANTIPFSEGIGFIADYRDEDKIDMVTYVTAHEVAHQWWGHQVIAADMQGGSMLVETLAQYSAIMVMEHKYGPEQIRKFLKFELDRYLRARGGEVVEELPLNRVENQGYIHYRKGSLAMYLLKDQIGEAAVNRALRQLLAQYAFKGAPYPKSSDLITLFKAEAGPAHHGLIEDLFEKITLVDLKATAAKTRQLPGGQWETTFNVDATKFHADGKGKETPAPLEAFIDVGLFAVEPGQKGYTKRDVLLLERRKVHTGTQQVVLRSAQRPKFVGIDPYNKWIDRNSDDNLTEVD